MTRPRITRRAVQDLDTIARWTLQTWGVERMETYLRALDARFNWLAENPQSGRKRDDIAKGYRSFPEGRHMIFYVEVDGSVAIIGVPHQSMDSSTYFG